MQAIGSDRPCARPPPGAKPGARLWRPDVSQQADPKTPVQAEPLPMEVEPATFLETLERLAGEARP